MKKFLYLFVFMLAAFVAKADNYFTIDGVVNDTLLINPLFLGNAVNIKFRAHFDGRLDYWHLTMIYPTGLSYGQQSNEEQDMDVPFVNRWGHDTVCEPELILLQNETVFMSSIVEPGYWDLDGDGYYDTYGTVKWEAGDYPEMFSMLLSINNSFRSDTLAIDGFLSSTHDWRGGTIGPGVYFNKNIIVHVGYKRGDVNGDGTLTTADVTLLISYTLNPDSSNLNEFQIAAGDVNGDGQVTIADVTALIPLALQNDGANGLEGLEDLGLGTLGF